MTGNTSNNPAYSTIQGNNLQSPRKPGVKSEKDPSVQSLDYQKMVPRWEFLKDVYTGTEALRIKSDVYLPRHESESLSSHKRRNATAYLDNYFALTVNSMSSRPFRDPIQLVTEDEDFKLWFDDIDLNGNNLDTFARAAFLKGLLKGMVYIICDYPSKESENLTKADIDEDQERPYLRMIDPEDVIFLSGTEEQGIEIITQVRIKEEFYEQDAYGEIHVKRIRVITPEKTEIWEVRSEKAGFAVPDSAKYQLVKEVEHTLGFIPISVWYTNKESLGSSFPPFLDLAYMNITHYQLSSDMRNAVTTSCFPILAASGISDEEVRSRTDGNKGIHVGPNTLLTTPSETSKFYYVEHSGKAISTAMAVLDQIEEKMVNYGAQFMKKEVRDVKATVRILNSSESGTNLQALTLTFKDFLQNAIYHMGRWAKKDGIENPENRPNIRMTTSLDIPEIGESSWNVLDKARTRKDISRVAYMNELKKRNLLSEDYDAVGDEIKIEEEREEELDQLIVKQEAQIEVSQAAQEEAMKKGIGGGGTPTGAAASGSSTGGSFGEGPTYRRGPYDKNSDNVPDTQYTPGYGNNKGG